MTINAYKKGGFYPSFFFVLFNNLFWSSSLSDGRQVWLLSDFHGGLQIGIKRVKETVSRQEWLVLGYQQGQILCHLT